MADTFEEEAKIDIVAVQQEIDVLEKGSIKQISALLQKELPELRGLFP
jgi:hypothetical protein